MKKGILALVLLNLFSRSVLADTTENQFVRLLVADSQLNQLQVLTPAAATTDILLLPQGGQKYLHASGSQRFALVVQPDANRVYFVDSAVESHGDHAHPDGKVRLAKTVSEAIKPIHIHTLGGRFVIFNDGNATTGHSSYSLGREAALYSANPLIEKPASINQHGAAVLFDNRNIAVTEKSASQAGSLPDRLTVRDQHNKVLTHLDNLQGLHGNAGNGSYALFGSQQGVVVATEAGKITVIPHPVGFNSEKGNWFGQLLYGQYHDIFVAQAANHGLYLVDPNKLTLHPIVKSNGIKAVTFDSQGKDLIVLDNSQQRILLMVIDAKSGKISNQTELTLASDAPIAIAASQKFIYVTDYNAQQVLQFDREDLNKIQHFDVAPLKPNKILFIGADLMEGHH